MTDHVNPSRESFRAFRDHPRSGPVQMLNLVKFRARAAYEDGRVATGAEAYDAYGRESGPIFRGLGGRIVWSGRPEVMVIGPETGEDWDIAFIAEYPSVDAFVAMIRDPDYQKAAQHRTAAVENSRLIRMEPRPGGSGFGL
jgi:uncharacterized protein (DUF1330 family)